MRGGRTTQTNLLMSILLSYTLGKEHEGDEDVHLLYKVYSWHIRDDVICVILHLTRELDTSENNLKVLRSRTRCHKQF